MQILLFAITNNPNDIPKDVSAPITDFIDVYVKGSFDILHPYIEVPYNPLYANANYCYLTELNKYYFITGRELSAGQKLTLTLEHDPLQNYANAILNSSQNIYRQEFLQNRYLMDSNFAIQTNKKQKIIELEGGDLNINQATTTSRNFCLIVAGGSVE